MAVHGLKPRSYGTMPFQGAWVLGLVAAREDSPEAMRLDRVISVKIFGEWATASLRRFIGGRISPLAGASGFAEASAEVAADEIRPVANLIQAGLSDCGSCFFGQLGREANGFARDG